MPDPTVFDFSAKDEDAITITFPDGKHSCELPTMEELTMETFQWIAANGDEWYRLFNKKKLTEADRKRFDHLNRHLAYALCEGVPHKVVDTLSTKERAQMIMGFMTASPLPEALRELVEKAAQKPPSRKRTTSR